MHFPIKPIRYAGALLVLAMLSAYCSSPQPAPKKTEPQPEPQPTVKKRDAGPSEADRLRQQALLLGNQLKSMPVFYYPPFRHQLSESEFKSTFGSNLDVMKSIASRVPPGYYLEVVGHANQHPKKDSAYTQELSRKRAEQVYNHLVSAGIPAAKMKFKGVSNTQPIDPAEPRAKKNRRVTFRLGYE